MEKAERRMEKFLVVFSVFLYSDFKDFTGFINAALIA